jgi:hypothetical protein
VYTDLFSCSQKYSRRNSSKMERAGRMAKRQKLYELQHDHFGKKQTINDKRRSGFNKREFAFLTEQVNESI